MKSESTAERILGSMSSESVSTRNQEWWKRGAIYEIAPISFQDSNGDGKGDLRGLIGRIEYLDWLGVGAVWMTPLYPSSMLDLMQLRRQEPILLDGEYVPVRSRNDILVYKRAHRSGEMLIALNLVHEPRKLHFEGRGTLLLSNRLDRASGAVECPSLLRPDEGIIVKLAR